MCITTRTRIVSSAELLIIVAETGGGTRAGPGGGPPDYEFHLCNGPQVSLGASIGRLMQRDSYNTRLVRRCATRWRWSEWLLVLLRSYCSRLVLPSQGVMALVKVGCFGVAATSCRCFVSLPREGVSLKRDISQHNQASVPCRCSARRSAGVCQRGQKCACSVPVCWQCGASARAGDAARWCAAHVLVFVLCACLCAVGVGSGCGTEALRGVVRSRAGVVRMRGPAVGPVGPRSKAVCQQNAAVVHSAQQNVQHMCSTVFGGSA